MWAIKREYGTPVKCRLSSFFSKFSNFLWWIVLRNFATISARRMRFRAKNLRVQPTVELFNTYLTNKSK